MKAIARDSKGKRVKCSTCGSKETAGAIMGVDSSIIFCAEHSPYRNYPEAKIVYDPLSAEELNKLKNNKDFICKDMWTADLREKK